MSTAAVLYMIVFAVLGVRAWLVLARGLYVIYDPSIPWWKKPFDKELIQRFYRFAVDFTASIGTGSLAIYLVPGVNGGAIGAFGGLVISILMQSTDWYRQRIKRKFHATPG